MIVVPTRCHVGNYTRGQRQPACNARNAFLSRLFGSVRRLGSCFALQGEAMDQASEGDAIDWLAPLQPQPSGEARAASSHGSAKLPHPKKRSALEHGFAALRMWCTKAARRDRATRSTMASAAAAALGKSARSQPNVRKARGVLSSLLRKGPGRLMLKRVDAQISVALGTAFSQLVRRNDAARATNVSPTWVSVCRRAVARGVLASQGSALKQICDGFRKTPGMKVFATSLAFDETTEKLHLPLHPLLSPAVQQSSWHVCVSLQQLVWGVQTPDGRRWKGSWEAIRPSVPLLATDGELIYDSLFGVPVGKTMAGIQAASVEAASVSIEHADRDGAGSKDRVFAAMVQSDKKSLMSNAVCGNHANSLAEGATIMSIAKEVLPKLYSLSLFLKMGGHFLRLLHSTAALVDEAFPAPIVGAAPAGSSDFVKAMLLYSVENYRRMGDDSLDQPETRLRRHRLYKQACDEFACFFSWVASRLVHFCGGAGCCESRDVYKRRAQQHIVGFVYRCAPTVPTKSKWTKTGQCLDFHVLAQGFELLGRQFALAFGAKGMQVHIVKASGFEDQLIAEEVSWHRVAGIRSAKANEMLADSQSYFRIGCGSQQGV